MRSHIREVIGYLSGIGIKPELRRGGKHPKLVFEHSGRTWKFPVPGSPGDQNAGRASIQQIRRALR